MESYPILSAWIQEMRQMKTRVSVDVESTVQSFMTEDQKEITVNREEDDHKLMTITMEHEIKWRHRPFTTIIYTSFQNHLIYDRHPMSPYEYFKQCVPDALFDLMSDSTNIYAMQSGTLGFKSTSSGEISVPSGGGQDLQRSN